MKRIGLGTALAALVTLGVGQNASATIFVTVDLDLATAGIQQNVTLPKLNPNPVRSGRIVAWSDVTDDDGGTFEIDTFSLRLNSSRPEATLVSPVRAGDLFDGAFGLALNDPIIPLDGFDGVADPDTSSGNMLFIAGNLGGIGLPASLPVIPTGDPTSGLIPADTLGIEILRFSFLVDGLDGSTSILDLINLSATEAAAQSQQVLVIGLSGSVTQAIPAPAPGSLALLAAGLLAFGTRLRRRG